MMLSHTTIVFMRYAMLALESRNSCDPRTIGDSSDDTYKDKKVKLDFGNKLSYPKDAYAPLGLFMGKFTRDGDLYKRNKLYYTTERTANGIIIQLHTIQSVTENYTVKETEDELKKLE